MKSYVSMEQHVCIVCGKHYDTGAILLDRRLKESMDICTLTGTGLCPEHQKLYDDGYVAAVAISNEHPDNDVTTVKLSAAIRTGGIVHIKFDLARKMFSGIEPEITPMVYITQDFFTLLQNS